MNQSETVNAQRVATRRIVRRFPTLDHVWLFTAIALIAFRPLLTPIPPHDFWWHMATGQLIVDTGQIPSVDQFSYTQAGQPFYNQSWLAQILMYGIYRLGGIPLVLVIQALVIALAYGLLLRLCIKRSGAIRLSVGLLLMTTMPLSFDNWNVRPQTYAFPIFVAFLYILTAWRTSNFRESTQQSESSSAESPSPRFKHRLWLLPLLMILWVNLHGSFVLGGALIALTFIGEWVHRFVADRREATAWATQPVGVAEDVLQRPVRPFRPPLRQLLVWGAVTAAVLLVNPRGIEVLDYVRNLLGTSSVTDLVTEWAPPTVRDTGGQIFFVFLMVGIAILTYARRVPNPIDMLLGAAFLWLALGGVRHIVWFGMVVTPLLVVQATTWGQSASATSSNRFTTPRPKFDGLPGLNAALIGMVTLLLILGLPWVKPALDLPPELGNLLAPDTPLAATEHLKADLDPPTRLFNAMGYGSYLIWAVPEQRVFVDPRIELYPFDQWQDYIKLSNGSDVVDLIEKYKIDGLLLDNENQTGLLQEVQRDPLWETRYKDEQSTYLVRRDT